MGMVTGTQSAEGWAGRSLGKYRLVEQLGRSGLDVVYKAYQSGLDRYVTIKLMQSFLAEDKDFMARFMREARLAASLRHPNIIQVHDFDIEGGVCYVVMEFIDGETLKQRLQDLEEKHQWISIDEAVRISLAVSSALKYAHQKGIVHCDIKPANVMIDRQGHVTLTDLGIARIYAGGAMGGAPSYMAPEKGQGQPSDERSDIYSLGVMLYQLVTARLPFEADTPWAVLLKHVNESPPMPRQLKPNVPEAVERVILKAMAKNPDDRYPHVGEMLDDLSRVLPAGATADEAGTTPSYLRPPGAAVEKGASPTAVLPSTPASKVWPSWKRVLADARARWSGGGESKPELPEKTVSEPARLRLDAAVPDQVNLGQTFDLAVAVRQVSSPPLAEDGLARTRSGEVQVAWHPTESYSHLRIQVSAPDCEIQGTDSHSFRLYPSQDSPVFYFQLIPKKLGEISIVVRVYQEDDWLGSTRVHTAAREQVTGGVQIETVSQPVSVHRTDGISNKRLPDPMNLTNLRQVLTTHFNDSELRDLCFFELRIDYDGLRGEGKEAKIRELIAYCERHGRISELIDTCKQLRPNVRDQA